MIPRPATVRRRRTSRTTPACPRAASGGHRRPPRRKSGFLLAFGLLLAAVPIDARVVRLEVERREDVLDGRPFGPAGPYEKIVGKLHFAVKPDDPRNRDIVDIGLAPVNADGAVEFAADIYLLRPKLPDRGNGTLFLEIPNRGGKGMLTVLNRATGSLDPTDAAHFGDGLLLRRGFTLAWLGWQFDVRDEPGRMRLHAPVAKGRRGLVRSDFVVVDPGVTFQPLGHVIAGRIGGKEYAVADPDHRATALSVRDRPEDPRRSISRERWRFVREDGRVTGIQVDDAFEPGRIYELIYAAEDPALVGLGLAAVRDLAAWAKHDDGAAAPAERAIAFGISQSGRFLRHLVWQGFNADEQGRRAYDGIMAHVAGAGRGSFNHRFAQPSRDGQPLEAIHYPTDLFPFTDAPLTDAVTGRTAGLLDRARRDGVVPRIFHSNTSYEYWGRAGSLVHTTPDGLRDAPFPPEVRVYHLAGLQHFSRPLPPRHSPIRHIRGRYVTNPNPRDWTMRALVVAMQDWITGRAEPPASRHPRLADGTLVSLERVRETFPAIPEVDLPRDVHRARRLDFGPRWNEGLLERHPPGVGEPFPSLVPAVDADGNDRGGIRIPEIEVPVATYTPWNLRDPEIGAPTERVSFLGAYFPFARNAEAREATGDPRPSLDERYPSFDAYLGRYSQAATRLVRQRFLLPEDLDAVLQRGVQEWRYARNGVESGGIMTSDDLDRLVAPEPDVWSAYGTAPHQYGKLRLPDGPGPHPVVVLIHGGCWLAAYDIEHIGAMADALTDIGVAVWALEYRRVGDEGGGWPGTFLDIAHGMDHLRHLARTHPLDLRRTLVAGHSAGGHLALWAAARRFIPAESALYTPDPLRVRGVLGLAAAADIVYLHERGVCGDVIGGLMGGAPQDVPDRYAVGSPLINLPREVPQVLINGAHDTFWSPVARRYIEAAREAGVRVEVVTAPDSGHFEMITPGTSTWPLVLDAVRALLTEDAVAVRRPDGIVRQEASAVDAQARARSSPARVSAIRSSPGSWRSR